VAQLLGSKHVVASVAVLLAGLLLERKLLACVHPCDVAWRGLCLLSGRSGSSKTTLPTGGTEFSDRRMVGTGTVSLVKALAIQFKPDLQQHVWCGPIVRVPAAKAPRLQHDDLMVIYHETAAARWPSISTTRARDPLRVHRCRDETPFS